MNSIVRVFIMCALCATFARAADAETAAMAKLPPPPYPVSGDHSGTVTLQVSFDSKGDVASCRVLKSSGSHDLDSETVDFATSHWHSRALAGQTIQVPIEYTPRSIPYGTPAIPNLLRAGEPPIIMRLWVTFDSEGYVKSFTVDPAYLNSPSCERMLGWIESHWRTKDYPHQTVAVNLHFDPPEAAIPGNATAN